MKEIISWSITVEWANGEIEELTDMPDDVSQTVDMWLGEIEQLKW